MQDIKEFSFYVDNSVLKQIENWQNWLSSERRMSWHTTQSYLIDLKEFFIFLFNLYKKRPLTLSILEGVTVTQFRSFLVDRSQHQIARSSLARNMIEQPSVNSASRTVCISSVRKSVQQS